jgi:hypothetical protein
MSRKLYMDKRTSVEGGRCLRKILEINANDLAAVGVARTPPPLLLTTRRLGRKGPPTATDQDKDQAIALEQQGQYIAARRD